MNGTTILPAGFDDSQSLYFIDERVRAIYASTPAEEISEDDVRKAALWAAIEPAHDEMFEVSPERWTTADERMAIFEAKRCRFAAELLDGDRAEMERLAAHLVRHEKAESVHTAGVGGLELCCVNCGGRMTA